MKIKKEELQKLDMKYINMINTILDYKIKIQENNISDLDFKTIKFRINLYKKLVYMDKKIINKICYNYINMLIDELLEEIENINIKVGL